MYPVHPVHYQRNVAGFGNTYERNPMAAVKIGALGAAVLGTTAFFSSAPSKRRNHTLVAAGVGAALYIAGYTAMSA